MLTFSAIAELVNVCICLILRNSYNSSIIKKEIHPKEYRPVLFIDNADGTEFIIPSTVATKDTAKAKTDKKVYPVFRVEISSATHPFYTGEAKTLDTAGRVERFKQKRAKANLTSHKATQGKGNK